MACEELPNYVNQFVDNLIIISQNFSLFQPLRKTFKPPKKKANLRQINSGPLKNNTVLRQVNNKPTTKDFDLRQLIKNPLKNDADLRQLDAVPLETDPEMRQSFKNDATPFFVDAAFENSFDQSRQQNISKQNQVS